MPGMFSSRAGGDPRPRSRARWIVPLVTLVLGIVLGGAGVWYLRGDDPAPVIAQPTAPATTPAVSDEVAVPAACLKIAAGAQDLQKLIDQAMEAAGRLDAAELSTLVRRIDKKQAGLRDDTTTCQRGVATAKPVTPTTVTATTTHTATTTQTATATVTAPPAPSPTPTSTATR